MNSLTQLMLSILLVVAGIWLIDLSGCTHPARFSPACVDAPDIPCR